MVSVFFYGLFMDAELLRARGLAPANLRRATVEGYALRIGERATLVAEAQARVPGVVMDLTHEEVDRLYAEPSVAMYRPLAVLARLEDGTAIAALAYVLPNPPAPHERNEAYAEKLAEVRRRVGIGE
jgi:Gamma-glutamyl cyclotransferase, AIG2-like